MEEVSGSYMHCSFSDCKFSRITTSDARVEVRTSAPKGGFSKLQNTKVKWQRSGDAVFHRECWDIVVKTCRMRSKTRAPFVLTSSRRLLWKKRQKQPSPWLARNCYCRSFENRQSYQERQALCCIYGCWDFDICRYWRLSRKIGQVDRGR